MEKLKPCPFCGGENIDYDVDDKYMPDTHIECLNCGACVDLRYSNISVSEKWNRRVEQGKEYEGKRIKRTS